MTSEKPDIKTSNRILPLQAIRGIAFMMIFLSHANVVWSNWGGCGVSIFYVLSGFVMIYTYYTKELDTSFRESFKFSLKKIKKLYPLHILTMCAAILLECIGIIKGFSIIEVIKMCIKIVPNMFLIQAWVPTSSIYFSLNGVAWYLSVLLILYMAFPLLLALIKKNDSEKKAIICMGATFIIQVIVTMLTLNIKGIDDKQTFSTWITYICPLFRLGDFFIGCNAGYLFLKHRNNINKYIAAIGEVVIFALMFAAVWFTGQTHTQFIARVFARTSLLCMPLSVAIIYLFASNKGIISKICTNKIIVYIGNISAYTFLIHQIAIRYVSGTASLINKEINQWVIAVVSFAVTIIGSIIFMKIEKKVKKAS